MLIVCKSNQLKSFKLTTDLLNRIVSKLIDGESEKKKYLEISFGQVDCQLNGSCVCVGGGGGGFYQ